MGDWCQFYMDKKSLEHSTFFNSTNSTFVITVLSNEKGLNQLLLTKPVVRYRYTYCCCYYLFDVTIFGNLHGVTVQPNHRVGTVLPVSEKDDNTNWQESYTLKQETYQRSTKVLREGSTFIVLLFHRKFPSLSIFNLTLFGKYMEQGK